MLVYLLKLLAQCGNFKGESSTLARQGGGEVKGWERGWGREKEKGGGGKAILTQDILEQSTTKKVTTCGMTTH